MVFAYPGVLNTAEWASVLSSLNAVAAHALCRGFQVVPIKRHVRALVHIGRCYLADMKPGKVRS
jgi:hypothetical protein